MAGVIRKREGRPIEALVDLFRAKQMLIFAAVRFVTDVTAVPERSLVKNFLGALKLGLSAMALSAGAYRVRTNEVRLIARVRVMAAEATALRPRVLDFCVLDLFCGFLVT